MRVVDAIADWFSAAGFTHYFGYAGGAIWPIMDGLIEHPEIQGVQAKHESHAVHQADVFWRETGRVAPVIVTKGPGIMNAVGGIASAMHDSVPLLVITGGTATHFFGKAGMQEMYYHGNEDTLNVLRPITKGTWLTIRPDTVIDTLNHALRVATSGRPGPVVVQIPTDIQWADIQGEIVAPSARSVRSAHRAAREDVAAAAELVRDAERPVLLLGGGVLHGEDAVASVQRFVEQLGIPTVTTLTAKGVLSEVHPLSLGPVGRSGTIAAARATRDADVLIAVGARFSDNNAGNWRKGAIYDIPKTKLIQVDVAPDEVGRNYEVELGLISDAVTFLRDLAEELGPQPLAIDDWRTTTSTFATEWREEVLGVTEGEFERIHPGRLSYELGEAMRQEPRAHVFVDVGDIIQYAEPYMTVHNPGSWHISSGMAEMGWATQGAIGAAFANPDVIPVALTGDGAFLMGPQVLATAMEYGKPCIWVIVNNAELGIEKKGAEKQFGRNHPWIFFRTPDGQPYNPDFVALARSFGGDGIRVEKAEDLRAAFQTALASGKPFVIDVDTDPNVPTYFTRGLDRAYPDNWARSYGAHGQMENK